MRKVQPSDRLRKEIQTFFEGMGSVDNGAEALSELVRLASTLMVQEGLEAEQADFVGRERYQRGERNGYRSGYKPGKLDTAEGRLQVDVPQIRDAQQPFRSKLFDLLKGDSQMLEYLATEMYARGLSTRDIAAAFTDEDGVCLLSRSGVSEVTEVLWEQYEAFQQRDLRDIPVLYLFLDGLYEPLRMHGVKREAVLCAWAITTEGHKVLLSLALGNKESYDAWLGFLRDLVSRGVPVPLTVTSDGAPGLLRAIDEVWPKSWRIRCWVHRMLNFKAKVPDHLWPEVKAHLQAIRDAPTREAGEATARDVLKRFRKDCPSLCTALSDDLEAWLNHLRVPWRHRKHVRTTNLIERSFVEERRRTKTIPRFFTEKSCLKLVHATLIRAADTWQRIGITATEHTQLNLLYQELNIAPANEISAVA